MVFKAPPRHPGAKNSWAFHDQNPAKQREDGREKKEEELEEDQHDSGKAISAPSPSAPLAMLAFLTGQLQHQGYERGSSRPAALDLHRVERDLEGGGTSIGEGKGKRRGGLEERCHGGSNRCEREGEGGRDRFAA